MTKPTMIRRSRPRAISKKREAERKAAGETFLHSTVRPSPLSGSSIKKGSQKNAKPKKARKKKARTPEQKERIYGTAEHTSWMQGLACAFCGTVGYSQVAHTRNGGTGRKADAKHTIPACGPHRVLGSMIRGCHYHFDASKKSWRAMFKTDELAARYAAEFARLSPRGIGSNG